MNTPEVFTVGLVWDTSKASVDTIGWTLDLMGQSNHPSGAPLLDINQVFNSQSDGQGLLRTMFHIHVNHVMQIRFLIPFLSPPLFILQKHQHTY